MKTVKIKDSSFLLEFSKLELEAVSNTLNEVCNGIEVPEFETRIGSSKEQLQELLRQISNTLTAGNQR